MPDEPWPSSAEIREYPGLNWVRQDIRPSTLLSPLRDGLHDEPATEASGIWRDLTNPQWSVSAFARDGSYRLPLQNYVKRGKNEARWRTRIPFKVVWNVSGRNDRDHLRIVQRRFWPVRLVIAHPISDADAELCRHARRRKYDKEDVRQEVLEAIGRLENWTTTLCASYSEKRFNIQWRGHVAAPLPLNRRSPLR